MAQHARHVCALTCIMSLCSRHIEEHGECNPRRAFELLNVALANSARGEHDALRSHDAGGVQATLKKV
jgi:hypothetical protein